MEQIVSPVNSTYAKGDRLTNQSAIQCLCGLIAFHSHVSRIWLRNYRLIYDTTEGGDWIGKRFCIIPIDGHPHTQRHERYREQRRGIPGDSPQVGHILRRTGQDGFIKGVSQ